LTAGYYAVFSIAKELGIFSLMPDSKLACHEEIQGVQRENHPRLFLVCESVALYTPRHAEESMHIIN
jgi:hypothetical protein